MGIETYVVESRPQKENEEANYQSHEHQTEKTRNLDHISVRKTVTTRYNYALFRSEQDLAETAQ